MIKCMFTLILFFLCLPALANKSFYVSGSSVVKDTESINDAKLILEHQLVNETIGEYLDSIKKENYPKEQIVALSVIMPFDIISRNFIVSGGETLKLNLDIEVRLNTKDIVFLLGAAQQKLSNKDYQDIEKQGKEYLENLILNDWSYGPAIVRMHSRLARLFLERINIEKHKITVNKRQSEKG